MRARLIGTAAAALAIAMAPAAYGQGSTVYTQSACMSARNGAGIAAPCGDGSAIFYSPGALAVQGGAVGLGATLVRTRSTFTFDDTPELRNEPDAERGPENAIVPHGYLTYRASERLGMGIGVWPPYGLSLVWPTEFEGRYTGYDNALRGLYIQPTAAYQVVPGVLSVGAGVDFVRGSIEVHQRADAPELGLFNVDIADVGLEGRGWAVTGHVGALLRLSDALSLGARYLHEATVDLDGDATFDFIPTATVLDPMIAQQFEEGQPLADQGVSTSMTLPSQFVVGAALRATPALQLLADYQWTGWSSFDQFELDFELETAEDRVLALDYRDASTYRVGAEYTVSEMLALRGGWVYNTAATPRATPLLPEGERNYYSVGIGYRIGERLNADAMAMALVQEDRRGAVRPGEPEVGVYTADGVLFGLTLSYRLGGPRSPAY